MWWVHLLSLVGVGFARSSVPRASPKEMDVLLHVWF